MKQPYVNFLPQYFPSIRLGFPTVRVACLLNVKAVKLFNGCFVTLTNSQSESRLYWQFDVDSRVDKLNTFKISKSKKIHHLKGGGICKVEYGYVFLTKYLRRENLQFLINEKFFLNFDNYTNCYYIDYEAVEKMSFIEEMCKDSDLTETDVEKIYLDRKGE